MIKKIILSIFAIGLLNCAVAKKITITMQNTNENIKLIVEEETNRGESSAHRIRKDFYEFRNNIVSREVEVDDNLSTAILRFYISHEMPAYDSYKGENGYGYIKRDKNILKIRPVIDGKTHEQFELNYLSLEDRTNIKIMDTVDGYIIILG